VDGILVSQGFRDLVDDARGVLLELLCEHHKSIAEESSELTDLDLSPETPQSMEICSSQALFVLKTKSIAQVYGLCCATITFRKIRLCRRHSSNA